ncbi:transporter substrate-binding domain-containing protein [Paucibacter sp. DJ1R-11]|nr:transporter substrate-binding domain-containing protein [Paucibacter sp. DJ1R-11]
MERSRPSMDTVCSRRQVCALAALPLFPPPPAHAVQSSAEPFATNAPAAKEAVPLSWVAGDLPPFAWQGQLGPEGYAYDLAQLMAERLGRRDTVSFFPWARAVRLVETGEAGGVFPLARTPDREHKFRWLILLMHVSYSFVGRTGERARGLSALRAARIGVLRGSPIIRNLQAERFRHIIEAKDYRELLRMLHGGMLTAIYAGTPMLNAAIELNGYARSDFLTLASLGEADLYMGVSLRMAETEVERWLWAYQQLVADGSVARLHQRYLK